MNGHMTISRRTALKAAGAGLIVAGTGAGGLVYGHNDAWAATAENLDVETFATLVQMSRDTYPHDRLEDSFYASAVSGLDTAAKDDAALKTMLSDGVVALNQAAGGSYSGIADADKRVALLKAIETGGFFQKVRGNLVTGLYNNKQVWPLFGYEGASADKGGYIDRGCNDIDWL